MIYLTSQIKKLVVFNVRANQNLIIIRPLLIDFTIKIRSEKCIPSIDWKYSVSIGNTAKTFINIIIIIRDLNCLLKISSLQQQQQQQQQQQYYYIMPSWRRRSPVHLFLLNMMNKPDIQPPTCTPQRRLFYFLTLKDT